MTTNNENQTSQPNIAVLCRDSILRMDITATLRDAGYEVCEFASYAALQESHDSTALDFAVVDIGRDMVAARQAVLTLRHNEIPMVLIHSIVEDIDPFVDIATAARVEKPFLPASLIPIMHRELRDRRDGHSRTG